METTASQINYVEVNDTVEGILRTRMNLGLHHLFAACRLSVRVGQIERENKDQPFGSFWEEIFQYSLGVATLTVAALESYANEMYFEGEILKPGLNSIAADEIFKLIDRKSVVDKYAVAFSITTGKLLDRGRAPTQDVAALIYLRNAVVHFHPEWFGKEHKHENLSRKLLDKFSPSVFLPNELIFPRAWASHSFTVWALKTTVEFIDHFHTEAGIVSPLVQFRQQLSALSDNAI